MDQSAIGSRCTANDVDGYVRFVGETDFSGGIWIGVELDLPVGKNDGSIQGKRYFSCGSEHGVFVRPVKVVLHKEADLSAGRAAASNEPPKTSALNSTAQTRIFGASQSQTRESPELQSLSVSTTSNIGQSFVTPYKVRDSGLPAKSNFTAGSQTVGRPGTVSRSSSSASIFRKPQAPSPQDRASPQTVAQKPHTIIRNSSFTRNGIEHDTKLLPITSRVSSVNTEPEKTLRSVEITDYPSLSQDSLPHVIADSGSLQAQSRLRSTDTSLADLYAKITSLEAQRNADVKRLSHLGGLEAEKQAWVTIRTKLRDKLQAQQMEIKTLKEQIKTLEVSLRDAIATEQNHNEDLETNSKEILEMAMLDREMAEEQRDQLLMELSQLKALNQELTLEIEIARESEAPEQADNTQNSGAVDTQALVLQNNRLRDALIQLKQITSHQDKDLLASNKQTEATKIANETLVLQLQESQNRLRDMESQVEDLRGQIDLSIGAQDMLEALTERNLSLGEQLEISKAEITDLQFLKELSDELDENRVLNQKELVNEIALRDSVIAEQTARIYASETSLSEYSYTIDKFRELVESLQGEIAQKELDGRSISTDTMELSTRAQDLLSQNVSLKMNEHKMALRRYEIEFRTSETHIALRHMDLLQPYLSACYETDKDSVETYIELLRISYIYKILRQVFMDEINLLELEDLDTFTRGAAALSDSRRLVSLILLEIDHSAPDNFSKLARARPAIVEVLTILQRLFHRIQNDGSNFSDWARSLVSAHAGIVDLRPQIHPLESLAGGDIASTLMSLLDHLDFAMNFKRRLDGLQTKHNGRPEMASISFTMISSSKMKDVRTLVNDMHESTRDLLSSRLATSEKLASTVLRLSHETDRFWQSVVSDCNPQASAETGSFAEPLSEKPSSISRAEEVLTSIQVIVASLNLEVKSQENFVQFAEIRAPWTVRGRSLQDSEDIDVLARERLKLAEKEVIELVKELRTKSKALEEEEIKSQSLVRRFDEQARESDEHRKLERNLSQFEVDKKTYEDAIEALTEQLEAMRARLKEDKRSSLVPLDHLADSVSSETALQQEIRILQATIKDLTLRLQESQHSQNSVKLSNLSRPLCNVPPLTKVSQTQELMKAFRQFSNGLHFVKFQTSDLSQSKWTAFREKNAYRHFSQEEQYAHLVGLGQDIIQGG